MRLVKVSGCSEPEADELSPFETCVLNEALEFIDRLPARQSQALKSAVGLTADTSDTLSRRFKVHKRSIQRDMVQGRRQLELRYADN